MHDVQLQQPMFKVYKLISLLNYYYLHIGLYDKKKYIVKLSQNYSTIFKCCEFVIKNLLSFSTFQYHFILFFEIT